MAVITINEELIENIYIAEFSDILNEINKAEINFQADDFQKVKAVVGDTVVFETFVNSQSKVYIYEIENRVSSGNNVKLVCMGIEQVSSNIDVDLTKLSNATNITSRAGNYVGVNSSLIYADLVGHIPGWSLDLSNATNVDTFRANDSDSVWNSMSNLANLLSQEISVNYETQTYIIADNLGNNLVDSINEKSDFEGAPNFTEQKAKGKKVIVYGKSNGTNQYKGEATDGSYVIGDKVIKITDLNLTSDNECENKANVELLKLKQNLEHYTIPIMKIGGSTGDILYNVSDTITVNSPSVDLVDRELKIVKINYYIIGKDEGLSVEVTNAEYSRALKSATQRAAEDNYNNRIGNTTNQGSGNTQNPEGQINATSVAPLRVSIPIGDSYKDETGQLRINKFTLDCDIDPYRKQVGDATATSDLLVDGSSADEDALVDGNSGSTAPIVTGVSSEETIIDSQGFDDAEINLSSGFNSKVLTELIVGSFDYIIVEFEVFPVFSTGSINYINVRFDGVGDTRELPYTIVPNITTFGIKDTILVPVHASISGNLYMDLTVGLAGLYEVEMSCYGFTRFHDHGDGSFAAENHSHTDGSFIADDHSHADGSYNVPQSELSSITFGDDVSDSANINASGFSWELREVVSGVSTVRNTGSEVFSGNTFINDIDISDNGTYPNTTNNWQLWVYPTNGTSADLVKGRINIEHNLDIK